MANARYAQVLRSANGDLSCGVPVSVYPAGSGSLATLYRNAAGTVAADNPVISDVGTGQVRFFAAAGLYDFKVGGATVAESVPILADLVTDGGTVTGLDVTGALRLTEGSNKRMGVATLVGGTVVVATTAAGTNSRIQLTAQTLGTIIVPAALAVSARINATSFTILSSDVTDTSVVAWLILDPIA